MIEATAWVGTMAGIMSALCVGMVYLLGKTGKMRARIEALEATQNFHTVWMVQVSKLILEGMGVDPKSITKATVDALRGAGAN
jgi:hypothetical protein